MNRLQRIVAGSVLASLLGIAGFAQAVNPDNDVISTPNTTRSLSATVGSQYANGNLVTNILGAGVDVTASNTDHKTEILAMCSSGATQATAVYGDSSSLADNILWCPGWTNWGAAVQGGILVL